MRVESLEASAALLTLDFARHSGGWKVLGVCSRAVDLDVVWIDSSEYLLSDGGTSEYQLGDTSR